MSECSSRRDHAYIYAQVPCKCMQAGDECPFSHTLPEPGQSKTICPWYSKGSCKFGHKCALAHIMPGEPMSNDRKNKRAQQLAQREASHRDHEPHGGIAPNDPLEHPHPTTADDVKGLHFQHESRSRETSPVRQPAFHTMAPRSALQSHPNMLAYATVAAAAPPLAARQLSNGQPLASPPLSRPMRLEQHGRQPSASSIHGGSPIFSTSPFSHPGTSSVFFSGSFGSDEGAKEGAFGGAASKRRTSPVRRNELANGNVRSLGADEADLEGPEDGSQGVNDPLERSRHEEDCLPSSLSDLMTPDEIRRRQRHLHQGLRSTATPESSAGLSRSVPHAPPLPSPSYSSQNSIASVQSPALLPHIHSASPGATAPSMLAVRALQANHPPGSSLPPGLAAGLSRLHFQAARHTGETPPPSQGASPISASGIGGSGTTITNKSPAMHAGSPLARSAWQHSTSPRMDETRSPSNLKDAISSFEGDEMPFELEY